MKNPYGPAYGRFKPVRALLLRLALGESTFQYMLRSIKNDPRLPSARLVDLVVRKDAVEQRIEADWIKNIARICFTTKVRHDPRC